MPWAAAAAVAGSLITAKGSKDAAKAAAQGTTTKQEIDPRIAGMLFGAGQRGLKPGATAQYANGQREYDPETRTWTGGGMTNPESDYATDSGLLGRYQGMLDTPQNAQLSQYGKDNLDYLGNANQDMASIRGAATGLLGGTQAPQAQAATIGAPAWARGNMVQAPSQNNINSAGAFDRMINGNAGANPYLTGAIQGGIDQSQRAFTRMQDDSTRNLKESILPSIRSNSVLTGQYGGSRQGIAEGRALGDFGREQQRAIEGFGANNTNAAVGAQASAFNQGQDRSLSALTNLSGQQYGVGSQDAATKNAAEFGNVNQVLDIQKSQAGLNQQTNLANMQSQQQNNALNQNGTQAGIGALGGLLGSAYNVGQNQDSYALNQASKVNGLLSPYMGVNGSSTTTQPLYDNKAGSYLGGAMAGLSLYNQFRQPQSQPYGGAIGQSSQPYGSNGVY